MTRQTSSPVWRVSATSAPEVLSDWLELQAVFESRSSSMEELISLLRSGGTIEEVVSPIGNLFDKGNEIAQSIAESALDIATDRAVSCGAEYPLSVSAQSVIPKPSARDSVYTFLLLLSTYGKDAASGCEDGAGLFEDVAGHALAKYMGGASTKAGVYQFGFPRRRTPAGFRPALDDLCTQMGEGGGSRSRPTTRHQKDAHLDIVAWIPMPDRRLGKVLVFGQCATGWDWRSKLTELQAREWCEHWMNDAPPVAPLRTFHIPHTVRTTEWIEYSRRGGIIFDRCRLTAFSLDMPGSLVGRIQEWNACVLEKKDPP